MTTTANRLISKLTILILLTLFLILLSANVLAEDATTSSTTRRDKIEDRVEARRLNVSEKLMMLREKIATKEAALKTKLNTFRNKQKAQIAERINKTLANINEKITAAMSKHLEVMSGILDKLEARVNENTPDIKDPAAVRGTIAEARDAIATANEAVNVQSEKDYVLEATTEATIREDMQTVKKQLHDDLKVLRELVINAKQKVAEAIRVAKSNAGGATNGQQ